VNKNEPWNKILIEVLELKEHIAWYAYPQKNKEDKDKDFFTRLIWWNKENNPISIRIIKERPLNILEWYNELINKSFW